MRGGAMRNLQLKLAEQTLTCSYDRANTGSRSPAPTPRTGQDFVEDLHALLVAANVPGPYVLVGYSAGGMFVQLYARKYADQIAGGLSLERQKPLSSWG
jgi:pimeloyl-ACP methyl ester carboxylesterase